MSMDLKHTPHRRYNPLLREWVLVSPHRTDRPWSGRTEEPPLAAPPAYDPECYLCPGNTRAGGVRNPQYAATFVFDNDYPALLPAADEAQLNESDLLVAATERGLCRVVCFSPRHHLSLATMEAGDIRHVVDVWTAQYRELGALPWVRAVQIFENRGVLMGASNPHPHGQIWANASLPNQPARELDSFAAYAKTHQQCLLCAYLDLEKAAGERLVFSNGAFHVVVPFWAVWPFEVLLTSDRHLGALPELTDGERDLLADALRRITVAYDRIFGVPFPYSMGFHQPPTDGAPHPEWHFHAHYFPPLLRSATVRKYMVGYEMLGTPQRDITPEVAAARLRAAMAGG